MFAGKRICFSKMITIGIITVSDKGSRGEREDLSAEE
ncbi:MAG TPA: molybdenum cofactor biosynthesis protein, partial [Candidatus Atribacteria bacterium]|nr:molybdenum cofactor biosynthesis protein [Candidatus Atribacteria bacterium]